MHVPPALLSSLHPLEIKVLSALGAHPETPLKEDVLAQHAGLEASQLSMAIGWLLSKKLISVEQESVRTVVALTEMGEDYVARQAPIERIVSALNEAHEHQRPLTMRDLQECQGLDPSALSGPVGILKKEGALRIVSGGVLERTGVPSRTAETLRDLLQRVHREPRELSSFSETEQGLIRQHAVKRGNAKEPFRLEERLDRTYRLTADGIVLHPHLKDLREEDVSQLTPELLKDGAWRTKRFRRYSIGLRPPRVAMGRKHPYREFLDGVKATLTGMGFQEMRGPLVETEFWNMDSLYMPQFHPARAIHDVYFVKEPSHAKSAPEPFLTEVAAAHRDGGQTGSTGWDYDYDRDRARRLVLRSQGTAVSARTLAGHPLIPGKYFSIARCFRYDQVDATHASDFFQVEGIVLGQDINFRILLGLLDLFAREVAQAKESRFLPAYFPFTEPSVELHVQHPKLGWMELGGAGLFRPEVTKPLGVDVPVIAWGLGLDRMAMIALDIHDIRNLFTSDLEMIRTMREAF